MQCKWSRRRIFHSNKPLGQLRRFSRSAQSYLYAQRMWEKTLSWKKRTRLRRSRATIFAFAKGKTGGNDAANYASMRKESSELVGASFTAMYILDFTAFVLSKVPKISRFYGYTFTPLNASDQERRTSKRSHFKQNRLSLQSENTSDNALIVKTICHTRTHGHFELFSRIWISLLRSKICHHNPSHLFRIQSSILTMRKVMAPFKDEFWWIRKEIALSGRRNIDRP